MAGKGSKKEEPSEFAKIYFDEFVRNLARQQSQGPGILGQNPDRRATSLESTRKSPKEEVEKEFLVNCGDKAKNVEVKGIMDAGYLFSGTSYVEYFLTTPTTADKEAYLRRAKQKAIENAKQNADPKNFRCSGKCPAGKTCGKYPSLAFVGDPVIDSAEWPTITGVWPIMSLWTIVKAHVTVKVQCPCMD